MKSYSFRVIIETDGQGAFHGFAPSLAGCHTWGHTIEETRKNLKGAIKCHIQGLLKDKQPIPQEENSMEIIQTFEAKELLAKC